MVTTIRAAPVVIGDVATVTVGKAAARHRRLDDADDIVQGIVLMRRGEESMPTIKRVEAEVDKDQQAASCRRACASSASTTAAT
jgi:cobalt-zinc-cadmium resistance protein CzcA